jgi:hypothetical protein
MQKKDLGNNDFFGPEHNQKSMIIVLILLVVLIGAFFIFDFRSNRHSEAMTPGAPTPAVSGQPAGLANSALNQQLIDVASSDASLSDLIKKVGKHIFLPSGQVTVSTVVDPDALRKDNPIFYQFAKKGDRVLIYPTKAILYDPAVDLVVDVIHSQSTTNNK